MRKTKIVCTLGPASSTEPVLEEMLRSGMNIARFNFSHGTHETHQKMIETFRRVRDRLELPAAVMLDTKGPEIRLRDFEGGSTFIGDGSEFVLTTQEVVGNAERASITYGELPKRLSAGNRILIDDGKVVLQVAECTETEIRCRVIHGGKIS
ncbi:MAG: pyruvate kinase, partial [Clostridia bacterium]|nr:pyruvate kinase [Clostridia bacterium]